MKAEFVFIPFAVKEDKIERTQTAIKEFISHIRKEEPGTLLYSSLQEKDRPNRFPHFMIFSDSTAHKNHRTTEYVEKFVQKLFPLCSEEPNPAFYDGYDISGQSADVIIKAD